MGSTWTQLFPDADYRFSMGIRKGDPARFYAPTAKDGVILEQRRHWIAEAPDEHAAMEPDGIDLLDEAIELAFQWRSVTEIDWTTTETSFGQKTKNENETASLSGRKCQELAKRWEPDFLLLRPDDEGVFRLAGGSVCFPSLWALREKMGRPLPEIHGVVPGLNAALERQIHSFLGRLPAGISWERENWGLSRTSEWNCHPRRNLPRLRPPLTLDEIWLRVEHQSFVALPRSHGILFGIRLSVHALRQIAQDGIAAKRLAHALQTMPEEMAHYKGLAEAREDLIGLLD